MSEPVQQFIAGLIMAVLSLFASYGLLGFIMWNTDIETWNNFDRFILIVLAFFITKSWKTSVEE